MFAFSCSGSCRLCEEQFMLRNGRFVQNRRRAMTYRSYERLFKTDKYFSIKFYSTSGCPLKKRRVIQLLLNYNTFCHVVTEDGYAMADDQKVPRNEVFTDQLALPVLCFLGQTLWRLRPQRSRVGSPSVPCLSDDGCDVPVCDRRLSGDDWVSVLCFSMWYGNIRYRGQGQVKGE